MTTPISGSLRATSNAFDISTTVAGRKAFRTSGRLMVILAMPSEVSYRMSSYSPMRFHPGVDSSFKSSLLERSLARMKCYAVAHAGGSSPHLRGSLRDPGRSSPHRGEPRRAGGDGGAETRGRSLPRRQGVPDRLARPGHG